MVLVVQGPGYRKMTIRLKDAAVWGEGGGGGGGGQVHTKQGHIHISILQLWV